MIFACCDSTFDVFLLLFFLFWVGKKLWDLFDPTHDLSKAIVEGLHRKIKKWVE